MRAIVWRALAIGGAVACIASARRAAAQDLPFPVRCDGQTVRDILIRTNPPALGDISKRSQTAARVLLAMHVTTNPEVVRRFVIQQVGRPCRELLRAESERILRAQPFLAEASVTAYGVEGGDVVLEVVTVDELSMLVDVGPTLSAPYVTRLRVGNGNLGGEGVAVLAGWRHADGPYRDDWSMSFADYQLGGRPYELLVDGRRRPLGGDWTTLAAHPFLTDLQRIAWRGATGARKEYVPLLRREVDAPSRLVSRAFTDVGGIVRIGEPGRLSLFGASFTREYGHVEDAYRRVTKSGVYADSAAAPRYPTYRSGRANVLWGVRNIRFVRVTGFDALAATQDVRIGFQLGTLAGRSLAVLGSKNDDIFLSADLYGGVGNATTLLALQLQGEGRQDYDAPGSAWDGILGSGRLAFYSRMTVRQTLVASGEWSGGWRQRLPFQVTLADHDGGVRGFGGARAGGAQRAVLRLEDRWYLGRVRRLADIGVAPFVDNGRLWSGDAPFGENTKVKTGVGLSFLAAVPPRSKRLFRLEIAYPVTPEPHTRLEVRLSSTDLTRHFWQDPADVRRSRESTVPASIFNWP